LVCPRSTCGSDAVEIIERNNDPRADRGGFTFHQAFDDADDDDDGDDDGDHRHRARATLFQFGGGPGLRFTSAQRSFRGPRGSNQPPRQGSAGSAGSDDDIPLAATEDMLNMFTNIVQALVGPVTSPGQPPNRPGEGGSPQPPGADEHNHTHSHAHAHAHAHMFGPAGLGSSERFYYDSSARLSPRDADAPQPAGEPRVVDLTAILSLLGSRQEGGGPALSPGPGNLLARLMGMPPGTEGDFVYSQAQLDRVLSQLMEQHQGNAPPPASTEAIESLPRVKVTQQMVLDGDDCAICKEELVIDEEVSQLPCKHCYHFQCVSRWLEEHDTCPICRHPITPEDPRQQPPTPNAQQPRSTVWPFNTPLRPPSESQSSGGSSSPSNGSNGGTRSSGGSRLADLFRRSHGDRSSS